MVVADSSANQWAIHKFLQTFKQLILEHLYFELYKKRTKWMVGCQFIPRVYVCTSKCVNFM